MSSMRISDDRVEKAARGAIGAVSDSTIAEKRCILLVADFEEFGFFPERTKRIIFRRF